MTELPEDLKYSKEHEWLKLEDDFAIVGITDHAQKQLTDIVFVELPEIGKEVEKDKTLATVESVKSVSDVFSPISGTVAETNQALIDSPETINNDCYGSGWIVKLKIKEKKEIDSLLSANEYKKLI